MKKQQPATGGGFIFHYRKDGTGHVEVALFKGKVRSAKATVYALKHHVHISNPTISKDKIDAGFMRQSLSQDIVKQMQAVYGTTKQVQFGNLIRNMSSVLESNFWVASVDEYETQDSLTAGKVATVGMTEDQFYQMWDEHDQRMKDAAGPNPSLSKFLIGQQEAYCQARSKGEL